MKILRTIFSDCLMKLKIILFRFCSINMFMKSSMNLTNSYTNVNFIVDIVIHNIQTTCLHLYNYHTNFIIH